MKLAQSLFSSGVLGNGKISEEIEYELQDENHGMFSHARPVERALIRRERASLAQQEHHIKGDWRSLLKNVLRIG